jgi:D-alanyl-D-alanine endopeptidase (penicillin-binding protein 7)
MISFTPVALAVYSAQIVIVVAIAAAGAALFRLPIARLRFAYWWTVIAACAALPLVPQWFATPVPMIIPAAAVPAALAEAAGSQARPLTAIVWMVLLGGAVVRALWLASGFLALRRLRASSRPVALDPDLESLAKAIAPAVEFRCHASATQPVTFGWRRPVVLLPELLTGMPLDVQRAALIHEALHVARRDWLRLIGEQAVQTVFWFHPAIWFAIDQAQLAREQIVDEAAVAATGGRQAYLTALVSFTDGFPTAALAAPFLRRHHILRRVEAITAPRRAPAWRIAACGLGLVMTTAMATAGAASLLPLQRDGGKGTVYVPGDGVSLPVVLTEVRPVYPQDAKADRVEGTVLMACVVTTEGGVAQIVVDRTLDSRLDEAAVAALEQWRFKPGTKDGVPVAVRVQIEMTFTLK